MKSLLLLLIFISFYSFTQTIIIEDKKNGKCANINNIYSYIRSRGDIFSLYKDYYGYNAQNCRLRDDDHYQCCYMSVRKNKTTKWHNFCGKVNMAKYAKNENKEDKKKSFVNKFIDDIIYETYKNALNFEVNEDNVKIDCFDKKINIAKSFCFAILFLLF